MPAHAQVWDTPKSTSKAMKKKAGGVKKKARDFRNHIKEWGLKEEYKHQLSVGAKLNSNGWSGIAYYQQVTAPGKKNVFSISFSEIKHDKQVKQEGSDKHPQLGMPSPYVFGKINNLYILQLGFGKETLLLPKVLDGNISIGCRFSGGFSLAMLKPYYLRLIYEDHTGNPVIATLEEHEYIKAQEPFLRTGNKLGASPWTKGLKQMKYSPGVFAEAAIVIEPATEAWFVQTITLGGNFAFYTDSQQIMANTKALPWQGSLFVGLALGKRW